MLQDKTILLVISGGIAAYKALELIRHLRKGGATVRCILTQGGAEFITPLSVASLSEHPVYTDLFSLKDESEMGHIRLSREADLIVVAPASASLISRLAQGRADDLAATTLLAADKPVLFAPAMNQMMWGNEATQDNIALLVERGYQQIGPASGEMACGETGLGRMVEPEEILEAIETHFRFADALKGKKVLVTAGPTYEPIDPVRFIGNRSSGRQGYAIAESLARAGAEVVLVSGPTSLASPQNVETLRCETAQEMLELCRNALPCDIAIYTAAVSDWAPQETSPVKIKKKGGPPPTISLRENPDILKSISNDAKGRPDLIIGFAAETDKVLENARAKLDSKKCDWLVVNDVSKPGQGFASANNKVTLLTGSDKQHWPLQSKQKIAGLLTQKIIDYIHSKPQQTHHKKAANS